MRHPGRGELPSHSEYIYWVDNREKVRGEAKPAQTRRQSTEEYVFSEHIEKQGECVLLKGSLQRVISKDVGEVHFSGATSSKQKAYKHVQDVTMHKLNQTEYPIT